MVTAAIMAARFIDRSSSKEGTMRSYPIRSLLALGAGLALIAAGGMSPLAAQGKGTIKIASQSPLSGGQAALGEGIKLGTQIAIEKLKGPLEKQGFKVELVPFDDQAKPDVGVANARNIIADKDIMVVIGHLNSGVAIPSSEVYKEVDLAMVSPANTNEKITDRGYPNVNRVCGRDDVQGPVGAEFAAGTLKVKTAYIVHDKTTYGQGVAEAFKKAIEKKGVKVVGFDGTEEKSNFDPIITPIKAKNPDLIYFGGIYDQGAPFFKQAREKGIKSKFLGPDGLDSSDLVKIAGKAVVGMYYTTAAAPASSPQAKQFADEFKKKFGKSPEPYAAESYVATAIALKALESVTAGGKAPTRPAVSAAIRKVKYTGMTGSIEFDDKGDPKKASYYVLQVASDNPEKWSENKEAKRLAIAAPTATK
jgi:branched-chain amino acid transport system substrate-binding protein